MKKNNNMSFEENIRYEAFKAKLKLVDDFNHNRMGHHDLKDGLKNIEDLVDDALIKHTPLYAALKED